LTVSPALERSKLASSYFEEYIQKDKLIDFINLLSNISPQNWEQLRNLIKFDDLELGSIKNIDEFKRLLTCITENHFADAFHLWTAERNGLDFFLMIEKRFINAIRDSGFTEFNCQPITPAEYCQLFL